MVAKMFKDVFEMIDKMKTTIVGMGELLVALQELTSLLGDRIDVVESKLTNHCGDGVAHNAKYG